MTAKRQPIQSVGHTYCIASGPLAIAILQVRSSHWGRYREATAPPDLWDSSGGADLTLYCKGKKLQAHQVTIQLSDKGKVLSGESL